MKFSSSFAIPWSAESDNEECHLLETTTSYWNRELGIPCEVPPQFRECGGGLGENIKISINTITISIINENILGVGSENDDEAF